MTPDIKEVKEWSKDVPKYFKNKFIKGRYGGAKSNGNNTAKKNK